MSNFGTDISGDFNDPKIWNQPPDGTTVPGASDTATIDEATVTMDGATVSVLYAGYGATLVGSFTTVLSMNLDDVTVTGGAITSDGNMGLTDVTLGSSPVQADSLLAIDLAGATAIVTTGVVLGGDTSNSQITAGSLSFTGTMTGSTVTYDGDTSDGSGSAILSGQVTSSNISGFGAISIGGELDSTSLTSTSGIAVNAPLTGGGNTFNALTVTLAYDGTLEGVSFVGVQAVSSSGSLTIAAGETVATAGFSSDGNLVVSSGAGIAATGNVSLGYTTEIDGFVDGTGVGISGSLLLTGSITTTGPGTEPGGSVLIGGGNATISSGAAITAPGNVLITKLGGIAANVQDSGNIASQATLEVTSATLELQVGLTSASELDLENGYGSAKFTAEAANIKIGQSATVDADVFSLSDTTMSVGTNLGFGNQGSSATTSSIDDSSVTVGGNLAVSTIAGVSVTDDSLLKVSGATTVGAASTGDSELTISDGSTLQQVGTLIDVGYSDSAASTLTVTGSDSSLIGTGTTLYVGYYGVGAATVDSGAGMTVAALELGGEADISGTLGVDGDDTTASIGVAVIGNAGTGELDVTSGASIIATSLFIGDHSGGSGSIDVAADSFLVATGSVEIGNVSGAQGMLAVGDGSGSGGLIAGRIDVGGATGAGTLEINIGSTVTADSVTVAATATLALAAAYLTTDTLTLTPGSLVKASGEIDGDVLGAGKITLDSIVALNLTGTVAAGVTMEFGGYDNEELDLAEPKNFAGTIDGFTTGDSIDLGPYASVSSDFVANQLTVTSGGELIASMYFIGLSPATPIVATVVGGKAVVVINCYAEGTRIATPHGERAIEDLRPGDRVLTASGTPRPVTWTGHRQLDCTRHPSPDKIWPIRIAAGAFADNMPHRDLFLSPDHAIFHDGVLIPIKLLVNGTTIRQEPRDAVVYHHIELHRHSVVFAEGLPAETYLDTGSRSNFANGAAALMLHPDLAARNWEANACAPLIVTGLRLDSARQKLAAQTHQLVPEKATSQRRR